MSRGFHTVRSAVRKSLFVLKHKGDVKELDCSDF